MQVFFMEKTMQEMVIKKSQEETGDDEPKNIFRTIDGVHFWRIRKQDIPKLMAGELIVKARSSCKKCYGRGYVGFIHGTTKKLICSCVLVGTKPVEKKEDEKEGNVDQCKDSPT